METFSTKGWFGPTKERIARRTSGRGPERGAGVDREGEVAEVDRESNREGQLRAGRGG